MPLPIRTILTVSALALCVSAAPAKEGTKPEVRAVFSWLVAGPAPLPLPAFADEGRRAWTTADLLASRQLPDGPLRPAAGTALEWFGGTAPAWEARSAGKDGALELDVPEAGAGETEERPPAVAWLASWVAVDRWGAFELRLGGTHPRRAWIDGEPVASGGTEAEESDPTAEVRLQRGKHLLLLKTVLDPARGKPWEVRAALSASGQGPAVTPSFSLDPRRDLVIRDVLDPPTIGSLDLSPDGTRLVAGVSRIVPGTDDTESWIEIRNTRAGEPESSWRGGAGARLVAWSPDGRYISYAAAAPGGDEHASTLFLYEVASGRVRPLLQDVERLDGYRWSPTGQAIVYWTTTEADKDERGVKLLEGLLDRWADYRNKKYLHLVTVPGGARRRLTAGSLTTDATDISPDGTRLLFTRQVEALDERPYTRTELWEMDLASLAARKLRDFRQLDGAQYGPRGERLLLTAPADAFGEVGVKLSTARIPNSFDGQLFVWEPGTDRVDALTRDFDPAVAGARWNPGDGKIYLTARERDYVRLYRCDPATGGFETLDTGHDVFEKTAIARGAPLAVGLGSSPWTPEALVAVDLERGAPRTLAHPAGDWFTDVRRGRVEPWRFETSGGETIDGRVYYPPDFDPSRTYPAIVYYYGGTLPVGREFGGRYPKELWAAQGYVVYVLQPSGAIGFGQEFSAEHVNDWGETTSEEIIEGTRRFLEAHPFVDPRRVGCIGASYGGFMTMLLATKTDLFAAAVAHAGISSLASYWGEGYWGFLYNAVAAADSFPWNRTDIYVDRSPLFRADRTRVPILLTHGVEDTNVPVGESDAFYIALELLGKEVEYLQIEGQDHWILDHAKRIVWNDSILAWFARHLKGQPAWWNALYPARAVE